MKKRDYKLLLVVTEVYRQQLWMYQNNKQSIEDRIVSLTQPHIRPIVRGKAGKPGEFGAKFSASCIDGYIFLDRISWDNWLFGLCDAMDGGYKGWNPYIERHLAIFVNSFRSRAN